MLSFVFDFFGTLSWIFIILFAAGIYLLYLYKKTRKRLYLFAGLVLTLIVGGLIVLFILAYITRITQPLCYAPMVAGAVKVKNRKELIEKIRNKVPKHVFEKIAKK